MSQKSVLKHIPKSQHRPIMIQVTAAVKSLEVLFRRKYNFKKANWRVFKIQLDKEIIGIKLEPENYLCFINLVKTILESVYPEDAERIIYLG